MKRDPVESSTIKAVGYDEKSETLEVEFRTGAVYQYYDFPAPLYRRLLQATSKGKFFAAEIKHDYRYQKMT